MSIPSEIEDDDESDRDIDGPCESDNESIMMKMTKINKLHIARQPTCGDHTCICYIRNIIFFTYFHLSIFTAWVKIPSTSKAVVTPSVRQHDVHEFSFFDSTYRLVKQ